MIKDTLKIIEKYSCSIPCWKEVKKIISRTDLKDKAEGKYEVPGSGCFYIIAGYDSHPFEEGKFEWHKKYIDIQVVLGGEEIIYNTPLSGAEPDGKGYSQENDIEFGSASAYDTLVMKEGDLAVLYPDDAHYPGCVSEAGTVKVKKLVIKVPAK